MQCASFLFVYLYFVENICDNLVEKTIFRFNIDNVAACNDSVYISSYHKNCPYNTKCYHHIFRYLFSENYN